MFTAQFIKRILFYCPKTGVFKWKVRQDRSPQWNAKYATKTAGATNKLLKGYIYISLNEKLIPAHRIAWVYMTGRWPKEEVDHINKNRSDNRWCNLRSATRKQNSVNRVINKNNTSGFRWVSPIDGKWRAQCGGHIGMFNTPQEAYKAALKVAKQKYKDFTPIEH